MVSNVESRFATTPVNLDMSRSTFDRDFSHKTTWNTGELIPFYVDEVLPGDTFDVSVASAVRLQTLLKPPMDNLYMDTYFFFVPNRLVWSHWKEFMGENSDSAWIPQIQYSKPQTSAPNNGWTAGTIADYMGIPTGVDGFTVDSMPFRAYALIVNEWFRSEVVQSPVVINVGDSNTTGSNGSTYTTDLEKGGKPFIVNRYFDYFSGCTPTAQKGPPVYLPIGDSNMWPVVPGSERFNASFALNSTKGFPIPMMMDLPEANPGGASPYWRSITNSSNDPISGLAYTSSGDLFNNSQSIGAGYGTLVPIPKDNQTYTYLIPSNLYALSPGGISGATINELRTAFQIQKFLEKQALYGSRYTETIRSMFGVTSPDARLQRPEYLGGTRRMINVNQVIQQSATDSTSPQGNLAGVSLTTDRFEGFRQSFTEHGLVIGLVCCRYNHTYQQGLDRLWSRKTIYDYYWPVFASLGNSPVFNRQIYLQGQVTDPLTGELYDDEVFGYQEAWAEYRYKPNMISGEMRSAYSQSLDSWHFGDDYAAMPVLSSSWLQEDKGNVDRALAVTSTVSNQFFGDFFIRNKCTRCMPLYSIPGLIDHH